MGKIIQGKDVTINYGVILDISRGDIILGDNISINYYTTIYGPTEIGSNCPIASHVVIVPIQHNFNKTDRLIYDQGTTVKKITIGDNCYIGAGVRILPGVTVGSGSVIGAGSVVIKDIPPNSVAVGNPARVIRNRKNGIKE